MKTQEGPDAVPVETENQDSSRFSAAFGTSPVPAASSGADTRQLKFYKALSLALLVLLVAGGGYYAYRQRTVQPVSILVNGVPVTTVANAAAAKADLAEAITQTVAAGYNASGDARFDAPVQIKRVDDGTPVDTDDSAVANIKTATTITVMADVILISGKPSVALADKDAAQAALNGVRSHYADMPPSDTVLDKPDFQEKVTIERRRVSAKLCKATADEATRFLISAPSPKNYTVEPGDTGWKIARKFHLSFSDFIRANAGRDLNRLAVGDTVSVGNTYPPLTVIVRKESNKSESILPGEKSDSAGERRVTLITTYMNGVSVGAPESVSVYTVKRAKPWSSIR